jgi:hypothetical protein
MDYQVGRSPIHDELQLLILHRTAQAPNSAAVESHHNQQRMPTDVSVSVSLRSRPSTSTRTRTSSRTTSEASNAAYA